MPCNTPPPPSSPLDIEEGMEDGPDQINLQPFDFEEDVVIILDDMSEEDDDSEVSFDRHQDAVFCCNFDKSGNLAVSGSQDETAYVWNTASGETKFECTGHKDSVVAVGFNYDSSFVATADMDGIIQAWNVESGTQIWMFETSEITWMKWHPSSNLIFAGTMDGDCWKWSIPDGNLSVLFPSNGSGSSCGVILPDGESMVSGYVDGSVKFWSANGPTLGSVASNEAHTSNVVSMACSMDGNLILTGCEGGSAKLIRSSNHKVLHTWDCSAPDVQEKESVESVGFFQSHPLIAAGTNSGNLRIWDISTYTQRAMVNVLDPIVKIICSDTSPLVYIAKNTDIELYDCRTGQLEKKWRGHTHSILDFTISTDKEKLLTASDDFFCKIFKT